MCITGRYLQICRPKHDNRPGYYLLQSSDCTLETCMLLAGMRVHEHLWPQLKPLNFHLGDDEDSVKVEVKVRQPALGELQLAYHATPHNIPI